MPGVDYDAVADLDVVPAVLSWLRTHSRIIEDFGEGHVSGTNRDPYPHIQVAHSPGGRPPDGRYFDWPEVAVTVWSSPDGTPGKAALRRLANVAVAVIAQMHEAAPNGSAPVVVTEAFPSSGMRHATDPRDPRGGGQQSWSCTMRFTAHAVYGRY